MSFQQAEELKQEISKWQNRARAAHKQGDCDLVRSALKEKRRYKRRLNELPGDDPPLRAPVPKRPLPSSGADEIVLSPLESDSKKGESDNE
ncbi:MAG TPA: hypothetical protein V6C86_08155 [Oculatellaceae cyanobacterium]